MKFKKNILIKKNYFIKFKIIIFISLNKFKILTFLNTLKINLSIWTISEPSVRRHPHQSSTSQSITLKRLHIHRFKVTEGLRARWPSNSKLNLPEDWITWECFLPTVDDTCRMRLTATLSYRADPLPEHRRQNTHRIVFWLTHTYILFLLAHTSVQMDEGLSTRLVAQFIQLCTGV